VEFSSDGSAWSSPTSPEILTHLDNVWEQVEVFDDVSSVTSTKRFARVRLIKQPGKD
jgi:hypothetical protein